MRRSIGLMLLPIIAAAVLWPRAGGATMLPARDRIVTDEIVLFGKRIPLPPGDWLVASTGYGQVMEENPGAYGAIGGVLLVRPDALGQAFLLIHTNALPVRDGWGQPPECVAGAVLFRSVAESRNRHNGCSFVTATRAGWLARARLPALGDNAAARARLPPWAVVAGLRVSDQRDVLDLRYGVMPHGLAASAWFGDADRLPPPHRALVARLGAWAQQARATALAALRDPADQVPALPDLPLSGPVSADPTHEEISAVTLGLYKLATYRIPASLTTLAIGWGLSGNVYTGVQMMLWQGITHSAVFFGNELAWEWPRPVPLMRFVGDRPSPPAGAEPGAATGAARPPRAASDAAPLPPPATTVPIDGKAVPLPGEGWTVLVSDRADGITTTILARRDGDALAGLAVARTNQRKQTAIFGPSSECWRSDVHFATIRYDTPEDGYCLYGKQVIPSQAGGGNGPWGQALERLKADGIRLPPSLLMVGMRARTRENLLDLRYYFAPTPALTNTDPNDAGLAPDLVAALQTWADLMQEPIERGVRGRAQAPEARAPWPWDVDAVTAALRAQAHGPLLALADAGALDDAALRRQRALADTALAERERQRWSLWSRSAYKVASYRVASYIDSAAVSWLITGSPSQSFAFATINAVVRPVMAYANEIAWAHSGVGKAPAPLVAVDFPEIGRDSP